MNNYHSLFRKATTADVGRCWEIVSQARKRMAEANRDQWRGEYPAEKDVQSDISKSIGYVLETPEMGIIAYGALITSGEPAYNKIDGKWLSNGEQYVVLHRLCVADDALGQGVARQYFHKAEKHALNLGIKWFRVDTNYDNVEMLHILPSIGFTYCGEITYEGGSRKAFEKAVTIEQ